MAPRGEQNRRDFGGKDNRGNHNDGRGGRARTAHLRQDSLYKPRERKFLDNGNNRWNQGVPKSEPILQVLSPEFKKLLVSFLWSKYKNRKS